MATCLLAKGKLKLGDARAALKVLAALGPPVSPFDHGENGTLRLTVESQCLFAVHRQAEAETLARRVFAQSPDDPSALFNLLDMLLAGDKFQEATKLARLAEQKFPGSPYTYVPLCRIAIAEKKLPEAQAALDKLVASPNQDANSLADAAKLALVLGRTEQALDLARKSLLIEPGTKEAQTILAKLNQQPTED
jgi:tetratricopeptide (TPR) repeat protein